MDGAGNLYLSSGHYIRRVDAATGTISTIAGTGVPGFSGDGGLATGAALNIPTYLSLDAAGNLYVTDSGNLRIRKLSLAQLVPNGVTNGANLTTGAVAPGEIVTIFGANLGPATPAGLQLDSSGRVANTLAGTSVTFDGTAAPLLYVSASQINLVVPYETAGRTSTQVQVIVQGQPTNTISLPVAPTSPGVFATVNADGSVNSSATPAPAGGVLVLYATGEGQTTPAGVDGAVATVSFPKPIAPVTVQIGGQNATVLYAGAAPGFVAGVLQLNVQIPPGVHGAAALQIQIGSAVTQAGLQVYVQ